MEVSGPQERSPNATLRPLLGVGLVLLAASLWGTLGTVYTLTIDGYGLTPLVVVFYRAAFGAAAIGLLLLAARRDLLRIPAGGRALVTAYGLLGVTVFYVVYIYAILLVGVTTAVVLLYTAPAIVAVLAWRFLGERLTRTKTLALALTFAGVVLVSGAYNLSGLGGNLLGIACGLIAGATYALYSIFGKLANSRSIPLPTLLFYTLAIGSLGLLAAILLTSPGTLLAPTAHPASWAVLAMLGTVQTLAPVAAYTLSLRHLDAASASVCATLEPVVAGALAIMVLHQPLVAPAVVGAALVLLAAGVVGGAFSPRGV